MAPRVEASREDLPRRPRERRDRRPPLRPRVAPQVRPRADRERSRALRRGRERAPGARGRLDRRAGGRPRALGQEDERPDHALLADAPADRRVRRSAPASAAGRDGERDVPRRTGRPGNPPPPSRRPLARRGANVPARPPARLPFGPRARGGRGRRRGLADLAPDHEAPRAAQGKRRGARGRRPRLAGHRGGEGRGRAPGLELQQGRGADRGARRRAAPAPRERLARAPEPSREDARGGGAPPGRPAPEGRDLTRRRRAGRPRGGDPPLEPARGRSRRRAVRGGRPDGARRRGVRPRGGFAFGGRRHREGKPEAPAPSPAQPSRERPRARRRRPRRSGRAPVRGGGAEVHVLDRGPGVAPDLVERIFEPFFRLPGASNGGAGLGLSIARQIARRHGGTVACLPREGGGTLFRATLR
ncbi:MAG: sensor histidine kinase [Holophagales bacterium]|nr:sensor histidine kinase [Holophagales bacterium]